MQLKEKPELHQINQESEFLAKTYQPDRSIKERKSVARVEWPDLPPLKERKSVATTDRQPREKLDLNQINQKLKVLVKTNRPDLQPIKEPKSVATTDRQDLRSIKNRKSVAKTYQPDLRFINEYKSGGGTSRIIDFFVVVIIIGILAHIALPSFLYCGNKAKHSEAKQYAGSMNRAQQAYFADKGAFSNSVNDLGLGIKTQTTNYNYSIGATKNAAFSYAVSRSNNIRSYVGAVFLVTVSPYNDKTTVPILCEATSFGKTQPPNPVIENDVPVCAAGSSEVSK
jgi:type IV pilus assembly protein PilA